MNAQQIIEEADTTRFNPREFRGEMICQGLINDVVKIFEARDE